MAPNAEAIDVSDSQDVADKFIIAAGNGDLKKLEAILRAYPDVINRAHTSKTGTKHRTALHQAAAMGQVDAIRLLVRHGADVEAVDYGMGRRPLHDAARNNDTRAIEALLDAGADVNGLSIHPTDRSIGSPIKKWPDDTPLDVAAGHGAKDAVELLLRRGAKLDGNPPECPKSALHHAVSYLYQPSRDRSQTASGNRDVIDLLVKHGGDFSARDILGRQPLHEAIASMCPESLAYILDTYPDKIDINAEGPMGYRPLAYAVFSGVGPQRKDDMVKVIKLLKKHGADISLVSGPAIPPLRPLDYAIRHKCGEQVLELLR